MRQLAFQLRREHIGHERTAMLRICPITLTRAATLRDPRPAPGTGG
ncbi:hypothetical protein Salmuc_01553 [Salipiger mucosus DSM 16094]|uniref:Uncharacterized protein n=1 Tax=Salipiger mucosus DSM 16094 TaxID=1123237 RepID=S9R4P4_9RHOB|nr:hypothetical protein Salmuc_01553 [Salipiger mucosus DSM 16094]